MPRSTRSHVLLISRAPEVHHDLIRSLHLEGHRVLAARRPSDAIVLLRRHPAFVFVDVTSNGCLTLPLVRAINRNACSACVAIHSGNLESADPTALHLSVDGFWRAGEALWEKTPASGHSTQLSCALN